MIPLYVASGIGSLLIILGFTALLSQKVYMDARTKQPIEIKIPIFGKLKANYPALAFVFLGCAMTVYGLRSVPHTKTWWRIDGRIITDVPINFQDGTLTIIPKSEKIDVDGATGNFTIEVPIEIGTTFEEAIELIDYTHNLGNAKIDPNAELELKKQQKPSRLTGLTKTTRSYTASFERFPK